MISSKRLILSRRRWWNHYYDAFLLSLGTFIIISYIGYFLSMGGNFHLVLLIIMIIPLMTTFLLIFKYKRLKLEELSTPYPKNENYEMVKGVIQELGWKIKVDNKGFIEVHTGDWSFNVRNREMFSIVIDEHRIFINCLSNNDYYIYQSWHLGHSDRNKKDFKRVLGEAVARKQASVDAKV